MAGHRLRRGGLPPAGTMKYLLNIAILIGLAAYVVKFYVTPLPELQNDAGQPLWRIQLVGLLLSLPDEHLFSNWFGSPPQFSLGDRLPVLLVAGLILTWAAALGWLLMVLLRWVCGAGVSPAPIKQLWGAGVSPASVWAGETPAPQLQLTQLETFVFAVAVGLSALSTWVLLLGLFGVLERTRVFAAPAIVTVLAAAGVGYGRWQQIANHRRLAAAGLVPNSRGPTAPGCRITGRRCLPAIPTTCSPGVGFGWRGRLCWRSSWPPCCRRPILTCANIICRHRRSFSNKGRSPFCRITSMPT